MAKIMSSTVGQRTDGWCSWHTCIFMVQWAPQPHRGNHEDQASIFIGIGVAPCSWMYQMMLPYTRQRKHGIIIDLNKYNQFYPDEWQELWWLEVSNETTLQYKSIFQAWKIGNDCSLICNFFQLLDTSQLLICEVEDGCDCPRAHMDFPDGCPCLEAPSNIPSWPEGTKMGIFNPENLLMLHVPELVYKPQFLIPVTPPYQFSLRNPGRSLMLWTPRRKGILGFLASQTSFRTTNLL